jgi:hypothetical protein
MYLQNVICNFLYTLLFHNITAVTKLRMLYVLKFMDEDKKKWCNFQCNLYQVDKGNRRQFGNYSQLQISSHLSIALQPFVGP